MCVCGGGGGLRGGIVNLEQTYENVVQIFVGYPLTPQVSTPVTDIFAKLAKCIVDYSQWTRGMSSLPWRL